MPSKTEISYKDKTKNKNKNLIVPKDLTNCIKYKCGYGPSKLETKSEIYIMDLYESVSTKQLSASRQSYYFLFLISNIGYSSGAGTLKNNFEAYILPIKKIVGGFHTQQR